MIACIRIGITFRIMENSSRWFNYTNFQPKPKGEKNEHTKIARFSIDARKCIVLGLRASGNASANCHPSDYCPAYHGANRYPSSNADNILIENIQTAHERKLRR
jgi:hypothetical protein